ncbi:MAG TPA: glycosyltransferase family 2 protein [Patescibacteria group bacterium]|nr:glycosyltransferase family 2 protein [Patescibacteria group bacterium]
MAEISIIIPMYNESRNIHPIYDAINKVIKPLKHKFEIIFIDDGSHDSTIENLDKLADKDSRVKPIQLARNFGKEIALTAGLHHAKGDAAIMIDADLQHPPELIPKFIKKWEDEGADLVIGVRTDTKTTPLKRLTSGTFYKMVGVLTETDLVPHATDYRLVDRQVIDAFNQFTERNRITRGLFDWLGFQRTFIYFKARERKFGKATYSFKKLFHLAMNSFIGHSLVPLKMAGYIGTIIMLTSVPLGVLIFLDRYLLKDQFGFHFSGSAILAVINLFLSGVTLSCIGMMSLYLGNVNKEVTNRPLYVVRPERRNGNGNGNGKH